MTSIEYYHKGEKFLDEYNKTSCIDSLNLALINYSKSIELQPDNPEALYKRAVVYGELEEYENKYIDLASVIRIYSIKLNKDKSNAKLHYKIGLAFKENFNENKYLEKARYHFNEALKFGYSNYDIYYEIAETYNHFPDNELKIAIKYYNKAIKLSLNISDYYLARGDCYCILKMQECALSDFNKGIELNSNDWRLYNRRGELFLELHKWHEATEDYVQFRKLCKNQITPKIGIHKNINGGPFLELYFAEDLLNHKFWNHSSYYIEDCMFIIFHNAFAVNQGTFSCYSIFEYNSDELKSVLVELKVIYNKLNTISNYKSFFEYMVSSKFIFTLIRYFNDYENKWEDILNDLKTISTQLINLLSDAILKHQKLFLFGI